MFDQSHNRGLLLKPRPRPNSPRWCDKYHTGSTRHNTELWAQPVLCGNKLAQTLHWSWVWLNLRTLKSSQPTIHARISLLLSQQLYFVFTEWLISPLYGLWMLNCLLDQRLTMEWIVLMLFMKWLSFSDVFMIWSSQLWVKSAIILSWSGNGNELPLMESCCLKISPVSAVSSIPPPPVSW